MTRPVFVIVCGINGAGKSTLADALARSPDLAGLPFLNPDCLSEMASLHRALSANIM